MNQSPLRSTQPPLLPNDLLMRMQSSKSLDSSNHFIKTTIFFYINQLAYPQKITTNMWKEMMFCELLPARKTSPELVDIETGMVDIANLLCI